MNEIWYVNNHPIKAWAQTGTLNGKPCGIIMAHVRISPFKEANEYVTAFYVLGDDHWTGGNYNHNLASAWEDFVDRACVRMR